MKLKQVHSKNESHVSRRSWRIFVPIFLFLCLLVLAVWVRFEKITIVGVTGEDEFEYLTEAKLWADGGPPHFMDGSQYYRPVAYLLQSWAIRIGGYNDYSVKILHVSMDVISIVLIFVITYLLCKSYWVACTASLLYAFLPYAIKLARSELVHTMSMTFVLLAFLFFLLFEKYERRESKLTFTPALLLYLSGFCAAVAANVHTDLAFFAPGYVVYLFFKTFGRRNKYNFYLAFVSYACIFCVGFVTPYFLGIIAFGIKMVYWVMLNEIGRGRALIEHKYNSVSKPMVFYNIFRVSLTYFERSGHFIGILLLVSPLIMIFRKWRKYHDPGVAYLPLMLILSYMAGYTVMASSAPWNYARLFLSLIPMTIFVVTYWYYQVIQQISGRFAVIIYTSIAALLLFLAHPKILPGQVEYRPIAYREAYDILKDKVNEENKLLVAPVIVRSLSLIKDRAFRSDIYFGNNAIYLCALPLKGEYNLEALSQLLSNKNISFIFIAKDNYLEVSDQPTPQNPKELIEWKLEVLSKRFSNWLSNENFTYSLDEDKRILLEYIQLRNGHLIQDGYFGQLYALES